MSSTKTSESATAGTGGAGAGNGAAGVQAGSSRGTTLEKYLTEIGRYTLLSLDEERSLAERARGGDVEARDLLIKSNLRLVVKFARDYSDYGLPILDLINEGNLGLLKAVENYDPNKGAKFSYYSSWWIKYAIQRALAHQGRTIRVPRYLHRHVSKVRRAAFRLEELLGRVPSEEEVAAEMGWPVKRVKRLLEAASPTVSLDAQLPGDDDRTLMDVVTDSDEPSVDERVDVNELMDRLPELINRLDAREAAILRSRFGLDGEDEKTLEEIGVDFGITRERIRQLQNLALRKLRDMIDAPDCVEVVA